MRKRLLPLLSVLMSASLVLAACATPTAAPTAVPPPPTSPPPATATAVPAPTAVPTAKPTAGPPNLAGETITLYHFGDLSGPLASITGPLIRGAEDAVKAVNDSGGIYGAKLKVKFSDTGGKVEESVAAYNRFKSSDKNMLLMITYGSGDAEALAPRIVEDKVPNLAAGLSSKAFYGKDSGYTFGLGPIYPDQIGYTMKFLKDNWAKYKPAGAGNDIKLAHISWPTAFGQGSLTDESRAYLKQIGVQIVLEEKYDPTPTAQTTTAILNANAAGANVIWTNTLAFGPAVILNDLNSLGLRNKFVVAADNWGMDLSLYAFLAKPEYGVGLIAPFPYLWWTDTNNDGIKYASKIYTDNKRAKGDQNVGYLLLIGGVDLGVKAIKKAIDTVGYKDLNGKAVADALIALGPQDVLNGVTRVDYSKGTRAPRYAQIRQIQGGPDKFVVLQDWTEMPDLRPK